MKNFKTSNTIIRKFKMDDVEDAYYNITKHEDITDMANFPSHRNLDETELIIKSAITEFETKEPVWAVEDKKLKKLVGFIKVSNYSTKNKMCNLTWTMAKNYWETSYMKEALEKIMNFMFVNEKMELINGEYFEQNKITGNILESVGMIKDGILRNRRINPVTKERESLVMCSITKDEFLARK